MACDFWVAFSAPEAGFLAAGVFFTAGLGLAESAVFVTPCNTDWTETSDVEAVYEHCRN